MNNLLGRISLGIEANEVMDAPLQHVDDNAENANQVVRNRHSSAQSTINGNNIENGEGNSCTLQ